VSGDPAFATFQAGQLAKVVQYTGRLMPVSADLYPKPGPFNRRCSLDCLPISNSKKAG